MARYAKLQRLLDEKPGIDIFAFYSKTLLDLRSLLFEWVDVQDWFSVASLPGNSEEKTRRSQELLDSALMLLQKKKGTAGLEFHVRSTETQVKQAYKDNPEQFVVDLAHGLQEEDKLTSEMKPQPLTVAEGGIFLPIKVLEQCITTCEEQIKNLQAEQEAVTQSVEHRGQSQSIEVSKICNEIRYILQGLTWHVNYWKTHQMHRCVKRRPEDGSEKSEYVQILCGNVCSLINSLLETVDLKLADKLKTKASPSGIPSPCIIRNNLQDILKKLVALCFVVVEQPADLTLMVEKKRDGRMDSKKFNSTVGLLAAGHLANSVALSDLAICLVFCEDLAQSQNLDTLPQSKIQSHKSHPRKEARHAADSADVPHQIKCEKMQVVDFKRPKSTKNACVYSQFFHVVFSAKVTFRHAHQQFDVPAQAISLPILVRTGAIQGPEHIGAMLWHSFSSKNMYDFSAELVSSMSIENVIQMISERILGIGGRGLMSYERDFFQKRLMRLATNGNSDGKPQLEVKLDNFLKGKVTLQVNTETVKTSFSMWLWLYSVINLLEDTLKEPWIDRVIYGFAGREHCIQALQDPSVPDGTFLLRFSESSKAGNHMYCKGSVALALKEKGKTHFPPPLSTQMIEGLGLAHVIRQIWWKCKYVQGTGISIRTLQKKYPPKNPDTDCTGFHLPSYAEWEDDNPAASPVGVKRLADESQACSMDYMSSDAKQYCPTPESPGSEASASPASLASLSTDSDDRQFQSVGIEYRHTSQRSYNLEPPQSSGLNVGSPGQTVRSPQNFSHPVNIPSTVLDEMSGESCFQDVKGNFQVLVDPSNLDLQPGQKVQLVPFSMVPESNHSLHQIRTSEESLFPDSDFSFVMETYDVSFEGTDPPNSGLDTEKQSGLEGLEQLGLN